ncbi:MAG: hypothetical protein K0R21_452 [Anaerocolumna sp.]|jgi:ABC-type glycerol-3-phosphate transport system substrate-binding protein|nr:hypothetical protein [Anaerocolumna sp.]
MKRRVLGLFMVLLLCIMSFAACKKDEKQPTQGAENITDANSANEDAGSSEDTAEDTTDERYQTSGKVIVAVNSGRSTDTYNLFANFNNYYPNIELETVTYDISTSEFLTAQAAAGTMPDVVIDDASQIYYYVSQGWVLPLDDYVADDEDYSYVPQPIKDSYTYSGKLYALPMQAHFNTVFINTDLLEELNLDLPELNWTPEDYKEFLKKGTTNEFSGTEILWGIDETFSGSMAPDASYYGYDMASKTFKTSETWVDAVNLMVELRAYPGLEAWSLRNSNVDGDSNDYVKKFGEGNLDDIHMAFKMGKILTDPRGTWDVSWLKDLSFEWTLWPWPQAGDAEGHLPMHIDNSWVVSSTQNPEAAFEVARYFTYSEEGNLERINMYETGDTDDYALKEQFYIPTTNNPEVADRFIALENVSEGIAYMYENMNNSFRADLSKIVPGWDQVSNEYLSPRGNEVRDGIEDAAAVAAELDDVATKAIQGYWNEFEEKLTSIQ